MRANGERNRMLDVVKGISILMVITDHFDMVIPKGNVIFEAIENSFLTTYIVTQAVPFFVLLSGYVMAVSFEQSQMITLDKTYFHKNIIKRCLRLYIPWIPVYLLALIVLWENGKQNWKFEEVLYMFLRGLEPGGYYIVVAMQLYLVFPIVFKVVKKYAIKGCFAFFLMQLFYEIAKNAYFMTERSYKYHVCGYIFLLSMGVYFALFGFKVKNCVAVLMVLAGVVGTEARITGAPIISFIFNYTEKRTLFGNLFVGGVFYFLYRWREQIHFLPLEVLGKASYSIMLIQSFVFGILHLECRFFDETENILLRLIKIVAISIFGGIVYYYVVEEGCTKDMIALAVKDSEISIVYSKSVGRILGRYSIVVCCLCLFGSGACHLLKNQNIMLDLDGGREGYASEYIFSGHAAKEVFRVGKRIQVKNFQIRTVTWNTEYPEGTFMFVRLMQSNRIVAKVQVPMNTVPDNNLLYIRFNDDLILEPEKEYTMVITSDCPKEATISVMMTDQFLRDANYCMINSQRLNDRDLCMRITGNIVRMENNEADK